MKASIVYHSRYGNTEQVALALAEQIRAAGHVAQLIPLGRRPPEVLDSDVLFLGGPTHFGTMTRPVSAFLKRLDTELWGLRPVVCFDTFGPTGDLEEARWKEGKVLFPGAVGRMEDLARSLGLRVYAEHLRCRVTGLRGPLAPEALEQARAFASAVVSHLFGSPIPARDARPAPVPIPLAAH